MTPVRFSIAISTTADSMENVESRLEMLLVASVMEVPREEIVGLVKTAEAALEPSDKALEYPSPVGDIAMSSIVFRCRSTGFLASFGSSSDRSSCSVNERCRFGLRCGPMTVPLPLPSLPLDSKLKMGMSVSDVFLSWLLPSPSRSAGVFAC